jgi:hypothetical protein
MSDSPQNKVRPFDAADILAGAKALSAELALGPPFDTFSITKKILDASGLVSARATTPAPRNGGWESGNPKKHKKGQNNASVCDQA